MTLSPRVSRLAAIVLTASLAIGSYSLFLDPWLARLEEDRGRIARAQDLLARYDRLVDEAPAIEKRLAAARQGQGNAAYLPGTNVVLAVANLQASVQSLAAAAGVNIRSSQTLPTQEGGSLTKIALQIEFGATHKTLLRFLHGIESSVPALFIETLNVRGSQSPISGLDRAEEQLTVRIQLYGYLGATS